MLRREPTPEEIMRAQTVADVDGRDVLRDMQQPEAIPLLGRSALALTGQAARDAQVENLTAHVRLPRDPRSARIGKIAL